MLIEDYCHIWRDTITWESVSNEHYTAENNNKTK